MRSENLRFPFLSVRLVRVQLTLRVGFLATGKPATTVIATSAVDVLWLNCQQIFFAIVYVRYFTRLANNIGEIYRQIQGMLCSLETLLIMDF